MTMCALRGVLERRGARGTSSQQQIEGIVVHALVDGLAKGVTRSDLLGEMERFLATQTQLPPWLLARTRRALRSMLTAAETWIAELPADRTLAGSEVRLSVPVPHEESVVHAGPGNRLRDNRFPREVVLEGRADRVDRAADGSMIIVDFKTGATVPSKATVAENAQRAVYQLAIELGAASGLVEKIGPTISTGPDGLQQEPPDEQPEDFPPDDEPDVEWLGDGGDPVHPVGRPGGAELIFLRSGAPNVRHQPPLDPEGALLWRSTVRDAAERLASSVSTAQENRYCERCPVRTSCPLQPEGRQVTR